MGQKARLDRSESGSIAKILVRSSIDMCFDILILVLKFFKIVSFLVRFLQKSILSPNSWEDCLYENLSSYWLISECVTFSGKRKKGGNDNKKG
jgi:hypothetical protein